MRGVLRKPWIVFSLLVEACRRLPGARWLGPAVPWLGRLSLLAGLAVLLAWSLERSPERISLADLAAGRLSHMQSWIIVSGDLALGPATSSGQQYRLTDPAAPNASLIIRSDVPLQPGRVTLSGRIDGGWDGVPPGYEWVARLDADPVLAAELPPPWAAGMLIGAWLLIAIRRRARYPAFVGETPTLVARATGLATGEVRAHEGSLAGRARKATLDLRSVQAGEAALAIDGIRIPVRLHSVYTTIDVGRLETLLGSRPALRLRSPDADLTLTLPTTRDRDAAFLALGGWAGIASA